MFVHQHQLEHLLSPEMYFCPRHYQVEMDRLFLPGWHPVATTTELPNNGDFVTFDLFDQPVLLRNMDGQYHAFLNVCAHRHCQLTARAKGNDPHFRCQYHGWEYQCDGRTARIPDARCFRPWDRENAHLRKFRTATCGGLIFVSLAETGPDLREFLGGYYDTCMQSFSPPFHFAWKYDAHYEANWKVPVDNTLEAYHIECLHQKTLHRAPTEENSHHTLDEHFTTLRTQAPDNYIRTMQNWMLRRLGVTPTNWYTHHHVHPHLVFIGMDMFNMVQVFRPTGPATSRHQIFLYTLHGPRRGPIARMVAQILSWLVVWATRKIVLEDAPIFTETQRGLRVSPHRGVLGTLEERLYVFQKYLLEACGSNSVIAHKQNGAVTSEKL